MVGLIYYIKTLIKYIIGPPEEVENNIITPSSVNIKVYKIKMDIYFIIIAICVLKLLVYHADYFRFWYVVDN